jgi:hypothetical protein
MRLSDITNENQIFDQVLNYECQINGQINNQIFCQVDNKIWHQIFNLVHNQVWNQVNGTE